MKKLSRKPSGQRKRRYSASLNMRVIAFGATLLVAVVAMALQIEAPVVWTFLTVAVSHTLYKPD